MNCEIMTVPRSRVGHLTGCTLPGAPQSNNLKGTTSIYNVFLVVQGHLWSLQDVILRNKAAQSEKYRIFDPQNIQLPALSQNAWAEHRY